LSVYLTPSALLTRMALETSYFDGSRITDARVRAYAGPLASPGARRALLATAREILPADIDDLTARYPQITVPALIVWGRHDRVVPLTTGERLSRAMPKARLIVFERCGHIPMEECPTETLAAVRAFLESSR
jgi:pimeloyl-ACP methyl ester carboxylesterase